MQRHQDGWSAGRQIRVPCGTHWLDSYNAGKKGMDGKWCAAVSHRLPWWPANAGTSSWAQGVLLCCPWHNTHMRLSLCTECKFVVHQLV